MALRIQKNILQGWKVLIVEDEPDNLDVICRILNHYGADIETATNGEEGLIVLRRFKPDFIISDISMPVMDGWEFCYNVQNDSAFASIPVFALTAHAMMGDRERALAAGFTDYMTKPLTPGTFMQQLIVALSKLPQFQQRISDLSASA